MSFIPDELLEGQNLISQFIIEYRGKGHFLPYDEYRIIQKWLKDAGDADALLLLLSDVIPGFYEPALKAGRQPPSLARLDRKVSAILEAQSGRSREL